MESRDGLKSPQGHGTEPDLIGVLQPLLVPKTPHSSGTGAHRVRLRLLPGYDEGQRGELRREFATATVPV